MKPSSANEPSLPRHPWAGLKSLAILTIALAAIVAILWFDSWFMQHVDMPQLDRNASYGLLFLVGFLTSFHCVGMCGPLIVGYIAKHACEGGQSHMPHLIYGLGKTLAYTLIGGLFGAFGSLLSFTPTTQGIVGIAAGLFLILFGLHMLNVFKALRHFEIPAPRLLNRFISIEYRKHQSPFAIGLLNGLMILCGPLQAMYIMAAGSGSWAEGARILLFFGLGTLPLLLGFGFLTTAAARSLGPKLLKASGAIVVILGTIMLNRGLSISGSGLDATTLVARISTMLSPAVSVFPYCEPEQIINMEVGNDGFRPNTFLLRRNVPVKWVINGKALNECNRQIVVPSLGLKIDVKSGLQTIEFTPKEATAIPWSCWMGMLQGTFVVIDDTKDRGALPAEESLTKQAVQRIQVIWKEWGQAMRSVDR